MPPWNNKGKKPRYNKNNNNENVTNHLAALAALHGITFEEAVRMLQDAPGPSHQRGVTTSGGRVWGSRQLMQRTFQKEIEKRRDSLRKQAQRRLERSLHVTRPRKSAPRYSIVGPVGRHPTRPARTRAASNTAQLQEALGMLSLSKNR